MRAPQKRFMIGLTLLPLFLSSLAVAQTFSYDADGHVTQVGYTNGTIIKYKYDAAGNIKKVKSNPAVTASISAGEPSGDKARFTVQRIGNLSQPLIIGLSAGSDAVNDHDYSSIPANVTIPAHESTVEFVVILRSDRLANPPKKLVIRLAESDDYDLDKNSSATVTLPEKK